LELVTFLCHHTGQVERSARRLEKRKDLEYEDALQHLLLATSDLLRDVCVDLDGRFVHLRNEPEFYVVAEPSDKRLAAYVIHSAERDVINALTGRGSKQRAFEASIVLVSDLDNYGEIDEGIDAEPSIVVGNLVEGALRFAATLGPAHAAAIGDILANEGLADYSDLVESAWNSERALQAKGRSLERIPADFIFKVHGLTSKQGRTLVRRVAEFTSNNGLVPTRRAA
jgi:hypothetical protein